MLIYIFNNPFPSTGGFAKRCLKEIEILSETNDIIVICRQDDKTKYITSIDTDFKKIPIYRFDTFFGITDKVQNYKNIAGLYELIRNIDLLRGLFTSLFKVLWKYRNNKIKLYAVVSPLTVPFITYFVGILFNAKPEIVEFHDLEPELAMHIKKLNKNSFVTKVEFLIEKIVCSMFNKIIVTSSSQAERIIKRTKVNAEKILIIPNSIQVESKKVNNEKVSDILRIGYISSFAYEYNINGLMELIKAVSNNRNLFINVEILIVGDGDLLIKVVKLVKDLDLEMVFKILGNIDNVNEIMSSVNVGIIPWKQDIMTETILPTKLFEYMYAGKVIIAPNFGEFKNILSHNTHALLYNSNRELEDFINELKEDKKLAINLGKNAYQLYSSKYCNSLYISTLQNFINK